MTQTLAEMTADLLARRVQRVHVLAWRDLDDIDAGGSEVHADEFMRRWADAGLTVTHRTSHAVGLHTVAERNGYRVIRRGSRYSVFPRTIAAEITRTMGPYDALVEIWNGVPWFSPVWCRRPRITMLHHVHLPMWEQMLPGPLAAFGRALETRIAPPCYRRTSVVTPSDATRAEVIDVLGLPAANVTSVPNGVDPRFTPGGSRAAAPTAVVVGRLAPVKRQHLAIEAAVAARARVPDLRVRIVGSGPQRDALLAQIDRHDAADWIELVGAIPHAELLAEYRAAWVVVSASLAEGWGLTLTEAAACGTPAVATDIAGHRCSVRDGVTGVLAPPERLGTALADVLTDHRRREQLGAAARDWARSLTWEATATGVLAALHAEVLDARPNRPSTGG